MISLFIDRTCGEACWAAREDICRCSCNSRNHGCTRSENGAQPTRTCRIQGRQFSLLNVGTYLDSNAYLHEHYGYKHSYYLLKEDRIVRRAASKSEIARWPELAAFREPRPAYDWQADPYLIWRAID